jgi:hypothetical protein
MVVGAEIIFPVSRIAGVNLLGFMGTKNRFCRNISSTSLGPVSRGRTQSTGMNCRCLNSPWIASLTDQKEIRAAIAELPVESPRS